MKGRMLSFVSICMIPLMMALTNFSMAEGPGNDNGIVPADSQNPIDRFFQAGYSYVYNNDDVDAGTWVSGTTVWDVYYKEAPNDPTYDYFVKKATIAWVKIDWIDDQSNPCSAIYYHAETGNNNNQLRLADTTLYYFEGNTLNGGVFTDISAEYSLDINNDQYADFGFKEWFTLVKNGGNPPGGIAGGYIQMRIAVTYHPPNWQVTGKTFTSMEFGFVANADIYDPPDDEVNIWNPNVPGWEGQETETGPVAVPLNGGGNPLPCAKIMEDGHKAVLIPRTAGASSANYYLVNYQASGEYSKEPSNYVNNENLNGDDGDPVMWCVYGYNIALNNFPPNGQNNLYIEVDVGGFTV